MWSLVRTCFQSMHVIEQVKGLCTCVYHLTYDVCMCVLHVTNTGLEEMVILLFVCAYHLLQHYCCGYRLFCDWSFNHVPVQGSPRE